MILVTILSEGQEIDASYQLLSLDIAMEFNRIPWARISFLDGDAAKPEFKVTNASAFEPGCELEISLVYQDIEGDKSKPFVFKGLVIGQRLELDADNSVLVIEIRDKARCMNGGRQTRFFEKLTDSDIMAQLVETENSLSKGTWQDTAFQHEKMIQFESTDWDFLLSRSEANGLLVAAANGKVSLLKADAEPQNTHIIIYGNSDIYDLEMESDAGDQFIKVKAVSWDAKEQKRQLNTETSTYKSDFGNLGTSSSAKELAAKEQNLFFGGSTPVQELNTWAKAIEVRSRLSVTRGRLSVPAMPQVKLGEFVDLSGIGNRFNGKALISGIRHRIIAGSWTTDLQLGLSQEPFWQNEHIMAPKAGGLIPGIQGMQIGTVSKFEEDPLKEFRVGVKLATAAKDEKNFVWARMATPDGGKDRGWFFYPEEGDEVILGFINGDPRQAIILGGLFGAGITPPSGFGKIDKDNAKKGIVTKTGQSIIFDDKEQLLTISTTDKNNIVFDEKNKKIAVADEHGNTITMSKDGISVNSKKAINFEAAGNKLVMDQSGVALTSAKKMSLEASAAMEIKGQKIDLV